MSYAKEVSIISMNYKFNRFSLNKSRSYQLNSHKQLGYPNGRSSRAILVTANSPAYRAELKADLLSLIKGVQRGVTADESDRAIIDQAASRLEKVSPNKDSLASPLINGKWRLVYTTSDSILGSKKPAPFRPWGPIYQYIDTSKMAALNTETAPFFNQVRAELTATSKSSVNAQFIFFKILGLIKVSAPASFKGTLDTTYLDFDMRISRGDKGNIFVLLMEEQGCFL
mmetsp:Transcript_11769/g.15940  ORF Transcript_11769/g.15940 Transcript_11769/m.15940 type:complete len:227 (-) Transcript_11769:50-730(-)|eukprot:CAMPEP_0196579190 /NCGR_PEP_ID=MMETSP1081-20130531/18354_1 /TAXON_ID=36882 /ORGANISM="Pyramimonas amylifera, Strain CCMP720" /LENGTH=226 /DNA_ID=CAMNT_0041898673 /DNA_START=159 /DNA_END=839 /DNA_ORIENTATION=-